MGKLVSSDDTARHVEFPDNWFPDDWTEGDQKDFMKKVRTQERITHMRKEIEQLQRERDEFKALVPLMDMTIDTLKKRLAAALQERDEWKAKCTNDE